MIDPTRIRLSDHFLLSDFMGCTSVYRHGLKNPFVGTDKHLEEGALLAEMLTNMQESYGPLSICYGYISPSLSQHIVKYQDPNKPSMHRWDFGAAADVCFHQIVTSRRASKFRSPIWTALQIDETWPVSRLITYSESPWICVGTKTGEPPERRLYENRYHGERKPQFIRYPKPNGGPRKLQDEVNFKPEIWEGAGYPTYHAGGRRGYEHYRVSKYTMLIDYLYHRASVDSGKHVRPPLTKEMNRALKRAGRIIDQITESLGVRPSMIAAYRPAEKQDWLDGYVRFTICPPVDGEDVAYEILADSGLHIEDEKVSDDIYHFHVEGEVQT